MANPLPGSDSNKKARSLRDLMKMGNNGGQEKDPWLDDEAPAASQGVDETTDQEREEILRRLKDQEKASTPAPKEKEAVSSAKGDPSEIDQLYEQQEKLLQENEQLRTIVDELKAGLEEAAKGGAAAGGGDEVAEREREYESLLDEKSEVIRTLHVRMQELEKQAASGGGGGSAAAAGGEAPDNQELLALSDELERERCQIEQERRQMEEDRRQLREDEEAMMRQMREMELQMAKERAELARQRNELQRLHSEIRHELELAQRDAAVNERLRLLQRRHQQAEQGSTGPPEEAAPPEKKKKSSSREVDVPKPGKPGTSGIMRRLFGGGD